MHCKQRVFAALTTLLVFPTQNCPIGLRFPIAYIDTMLAQNIKHRAN